MYTYVPTVYAVPQLHDFFGANPNPDPRLYVSARIRIRIWILDPEPVLFIIGLYDVNQHWIIIFF